MSLANVCAFDGGINPTPRSRDYACVSEVVLQCAVVGEQQARAADPGEGKHVLVVRSGVNRLQFSLSRVYLRIWNSDRASRLLSRLEEPLEVWVLDKFSEKPAAGNDDAPLLRPNHSRKNNPDPVGFAPKT